MTVLDLSHTQHKVRVAGIDAPEKGQAFGMASKRRFSNLVFQRDVVVTWSKRDRYGRLVGVVQTGDRLDAGRALVREGLALGLDNYVSTTFLNRINDLRMSEAPKWEGTVSTVKMKRRRPSCSHFGTLRPVNSVPTGLLKRINQLRMPGWRDQEITAERSSVVKCIA